MCASIAQTSNTVRKPVDEYGFSQNKDIFSFYLSRAKLIDERIGLILDIASLSVNKPVTPEQVKLHGAAAVYLFLQSLEYARDIYETILKDYKRIERFYSVFRQVRDENLQPVLKKLEEDIFSCLKKYFNHYKPHLGDNEKRLLEATLTKIDTGAVAIGQFSLYLINMKKYIKKNIFPEHDIFQQKNFDELLAVVKGAYNFDDIALFVEEKQKPFVSSVQILEVSETVERSSVDQLEPSESSTRSAPVGLPLSPQPWPAWSPSSMQPKPVSDAAVINTTDSGVDVVPGGFGSLISSGILVRHDDENGINTQKLAAELQKLSLNGNHDVARPSTSENEPEPSTLASEPEPSTLASEPKPSTLASEFEQTIPQATLANEITEENFTAALPSPSLQVSKKPRRGSPHVRPTESDIIEEDPMVIPLASWPSKKLAPPSGLQARLTGLEHWWQNQYAEWKSGLQARLTRLENWWQNQYAEWRSGLLEGLQTRLTGLKDWRQRQCDKWGSRLQTRLKGLEDWWQSQYAKWRSRLKTRLAQLQQWWQSQRDGWEDTYKRLVSSLDKFF